MNNFKNDITASKKNSYLRSLRILLIVMIFSSMLFFYYTANLINFKKTINAFYTSINSIDINTDLSSLLQLQNLKNESDYDRQLMNKSIQIISRYSQPLNSTNEQLICPLIPPNLGTRVKLDLEPKELNEIELKLRKIMPNLALGGQWKPNTCIPRYKIAIIVPYRDREENLKLFLNHMHPFLAKQQLEYGIYIIEPLGNLTFNRGFLMNIGFVEALKDKNDWQCFTFHDVDLLPEDERNIYSCPETPRHMSSAVSTLKYRLPYEKIFGGVTSFTKEQYYKINGFSNVFFGWGGEVSFLFK